MEETPNQVNTNMYTVNTLNNPACFTQYFISHHMKCSETSKLACAPQCTPHKSHDNKFMFGPPVHFRQLCYYLKTLPALDLTYKACALTCIPYKSQYKQILVNML